MSDLSDVSGRSFHSPGSQNSEGSIPLSSQTCNLNSQQVPARGSQQIRNFKSDTKNLKINLKTNRQPVWRHLNRNYVVLIQHFEPFAAYELIPVLYLLKAQLW